MHRLAVAPVSEAVVVVAVEAARVAAAEVVQAAALADRGTSQD